MVDKSNSDKKTDFNNISGLWAGRGKVAFTGNCREEVLIPKGAKLLVFKNTNATPENRQPQYNLVFVIESDEKQ